MSDKIGFIGLGVMGEAMCRNLARKGGRPVMGCDMRKEPLDRLAADGVQSGSLADVARDCSTILMCLPGGQQVEAVTKGDGGLVGQLRSGQTLVDMSTSPPRLMRELDALCKSKGVAFADAPVARTRRAAVDGTLSITVGAPKPLFDALRPILSTMGSEVTHCGDVGTGQVFKILNNMIVFEVTNAVAEALSIAEANGVDGTLFCETMTKGSADSFVLRNHGMKHMLPQDYPEQSFSVRYAQKDLSYALELAREAGVEARGAELVNERFEQAIAHGDGDRYHPVIRRRLTPS